MPAKSLIKSRIRSVIQPANVISILFLAIIAGLLFVFSRNSAVQTPAGGAAQEAGTGTIEVFFSAPDDPASRTQRGGPDADLAASIRSARRSVDIAAYNLDLWSVRDALLEAFDAGVTVRFVVEDSHLEEAEVQDLITRGIEVVADSDEALMHHKFVIVDQWDVWTGSMNFTLNGAYRNDNNLLHLRSGSVAKNFEREFEEMFLEGRFGRLSRRDTPFPRLDLESAQVETYFSPDDDPLVGLLEALQTAETQVLVMAYTLTQDALTEILIEQSRNGQDVRVLMEAGQISSTGNDFIQLKEGGVDARTDRNPYNMHHKVIILDERTVITGSYNFTRSAEERNDENLLIIKDEDLAAAYLVEFSRIWEAAQ